MPVPDPEIAPGTHGYGAPELLAAIATALWSGGVGWLYLTNRAPLPTGALSVAATLLAIIVPVALVCIVAALARMARALRIERRALAVELATLRARPATPDLDARLTALARDQSVLSSHLDELRLRTGPGGRLSAPIRPQGQQNAAPIDREVQAAPQLDLDATRDGDPLPPEDFIRALDFPNDESDEDGFRVLRAALRHRPTARLAATAQDVLTRLAQDGIYMDDLTVHPGDPVLWRAFAAGKRGEEMAGLGGIRDRSSLALTTGRLRDDPASRDAVHRFLRTFDTVFAGFAATASESELIRFADTRTARAFMLCARAVGAFDTPEGGRKRPNGPEVSPPSSDASTSPENHRLA